MSGSNSQMLDFKSLGAIAVAGAVSLAAVSASAAPTTPNDLNDGVPDLFDAVNAITAASNVNTVGATSATSFTRNADLNSLKIDDALDMSFIFTGTSSPVIGLTAGYSNSLGYYSDLGIGLDKTAAVPDLPVTGFRLTGAGVIGNAFLGRSLITPPGPPPRGLYIDVDSNRDGITDVTYHSEEALNGGDDHMIAYDLSSLGQISVWMDDGLGGGGGAGATLYHFLNPILVGWEDLPLPGDNDYDDVMFLVDATVVPLPAPILLLMGGLAGLGFVSRKRKAA